MTDDFAKDRSCQATPREELERQITSYTIAKNEREWWACREIESLRARIEELERENYIWVAMRRPKADLLARIAELEAALKPFDERLKVLETVPNAAKYATSTDIDIVHLRAARAALKGENG